MFENQFSMILILWMQYFSETKYPEIETESDFAGLGPQLKFRFWRLFSLLKTVWFWL